MGMMPQDPREADRDRDAAEPADPPGERMDEIVAEDRRQRAEDRDQRDRDIGRDEAQRAV